MLAKYVVSFCVLTTFLLIPSISRTSTPHIIGAHDAGFFSSFFGVLNHLQWCDRNYKDCFVIWDHKSLYWQPEGYNGSFNAWEYYFEQPSTIDFDHTVTADCYWFAPDMSCITVYSHEKELTPAYRMEINNLINKYIHVKQPVMDKVDSFYEQHLRGKKTVGIHLRGTDKHTEVPTVPFNAFMQIASLFKGYQFFIASDEERLIQKAQQLLSATGPVIYYDAHRSSSDFPIHLQQTLPKALLGEDVLIEALLLARCDFFIHSFSNVSTAVLYFNPYLDHLLLEVGSFLHAGYSYCYS